MTGAARVAWRREAALIAVVVALAVLPHARTATYGFVNWDDDRFIVDNPLFQGGIGAYLWAALTRPQFEAYHPLHLLSYLPDRMLWPHHPAGFHVVSLVLFAVNALLLYGLARRRAGVAGALAAVLLFAVHPFCVEPVSWITARKDLLAGAFSLGALLVEDRRQPSATRASLLGLALFVAAFLSKTSVLTFPLLLCAWLLWMRRLDARAAIRRAAPYAALAVIPAVAVLAIWTRHKMLVERPVGAPVDVLSTIGVYGRRLFWPSDLAAMYPAGVPHPRLTAALVVLAVALVIFCWRRLPGPARFACVAFPVALLPVANLVPINLRFGDRYAFLAVEMMVVPAAVALGAGFRSGASNRWLAAAACGIALLLLGRATLTLTATWVTSRALWAHAVATQPDAVMAHVNFGETLAEERDWPAAAREFQTAVRMLPLNSFGYAGLLKVYAGRAEQEGRLPPGTARRWSEAFLRSQYRSSTFDAFMLAVPHALCRACADTLLLMRLRRWPRPDEVLLKSARAALDGGSPDAAVVLLDAASDKSSGEWSALWAEAIRAVPASPP